MTQCWQINPLERPSYTAIVNNVELLLLGYPDIDDETEQAVVRVNFTTTLETGVNEESTQGDESND